MNTETISKDWEELTEALNALGLTVVDAEEIFNVSLSEHKPTPLAVSIILLLLHSGLLDIEDVYSARRAIKGD